jgi:hypothetical protein
MLLHEDETQQIKWMRCDVERNVPQGGNFALYPKKIIKKKKKKKTLNLQLELLISINFSYPLV